MDALAQRRESIAGSRRTSTISVSNAGSQSRRTSFEARLRRHSTLGEERTRQKSSMGVDADADVPGRRPSIAQSVQSDGYSMLQVPLGKANQVRRRSKVSSGDVDASKGDASKGDANQVRRRSKVSSGEADASKGDADARRKSDPLVEVGEPKMVHSTSKSSLGNGKAKCEVQSDEAPPSPRRKEGLSVKKSSSGKMARASTLITVTPALGQSPSSSESPAQHSPAQSVATNNAETEAHDDEVFEGVPIRKPKDRLKAVDEEADMPEQGEPELPPAGVLLQTSPLFKGFNVHLMQHLVGDIEERTFRCGEQIYKEGERQHWLGVLEVGTASVHVLSSDAGSSQVRLGGADVQAGTVFGELAALGVRDARTSTLIAESDCKVLVLEGKQLWSVVEEYPAEHSQLVQVCNKWKIFLSCHLVAACHPEVAYQLRLQGQSVTMLQGETMVLTSTKNPAEKLKQYDAAAVVEVGRLFSLGEKREAHGPGSMVNEAAVLGMRGVVSVQATEGSCCATMVSREVLWRSTGVLNKEREIFVKMTLERLPPSTFDISSCPILTYLQGSQGFWRIIQNLVRQRVCHPGMDICGADDVTDALTFFQQGTADVLIADHEIGKIKTGECFGDLNFLGIANRCMVNVRAREFCVLQAVHRAEVEPHLQRHHTVRARFRELSKLRPYYKRDSATELQIKQLQEITFFRDVSESFLVDLHAMLEDRIYLPQQTILDPAVTSSPMFILLAGNADCRNSDDDESTTYQLVPGDIVGEMGLLCVSLECKAVVTTSSVCCVQILHREVFLELLRAHPEEKHHFETIAKLQTAKPSSTENELHSNIYMLPDFKNCGHRFLYLLDLHLLRHMFFSGEHIVREGTQGEEMYILYSGTADVVVRSMNVAAIHGGQYFGEMAVLGLAKKRTASIVARILCDVRILSSKSLEAAIKEFPEERARFESLAATRNRVSNESKSGGKVKQTSMFFVDCDPKFAAAISDLMEDQLYMPGQTLMKEGERGESMFLLHQGKAEITANGVHVAEIGDHDVVGEMAVLGFSPFRTATVTAREVCFVQVLHRSNLLPVLQQFPVEKNRLRLKAAQRLECRHTADSVRSLEIFRSSPKNFGDFVDKHTERRVYFNEDVIVREGAGGRHLFMIFSGRASVSIEGEVVAELGPGDIVGELSGLNVVEKRTATVTCKEVCDVYTLARAHLSEALEKWPDQAFRLKALAARRMRENVERHTKNSFLSNCPLFEQCSHKFLQCISIHLEDKLYMPGENLCAEGERGDTMFILVSGTLDCVVGGQKVSEMYQGAIIGEIAVLGLSQVRTATLRAQTVCLVQMLHRPIFMKYLAEFPREMIHFQEVGTARLEKTPVSGDQNIFRKQVLFNNCDNAFLEELLKKLHRKFFFAGQKIVREGSDSNEMYAIQQGHAVVERRGVGIGEIEAGFCFGEMAVMGITITQTVTVRAETLCDMQVLVRWDLEELMKEHRQERKRLLRVIASMMREDLAEVTNLEILTEIPMFHDADIKLLQSLESSSEVELARKDEFVLHEGEDMMFVILQGMARVEIGGVPVRNLTEGDTFGSVGVLGLQDERNVSVRAISVCLALTFSKKLLETAVEETGSKGRRFFQALYRKLQCEPDIRKKAIVDSPVLQHLELTADQCMSLLSTCEEAVFMPDEAILHDDSEVLLFVLCGKVSVNSGMDVIVLEKGSSCGQISADNAQGVAPNIYAVQPSKVMLLWRSSFFAVLDSFHADEKARILAKLGSVPRQRRNTTLSGTSLRQRTDWLAASYINQVKMSLRVKVGRPKDHNKKLLWKAVQKHAIISRFVKGMAADAANKEQAAPEAGREPEKTKTQVEMDYQERLLRHEFVRLTCVAKHTAEEARKDHVRLRRQADQLRVKAMSLEHDSDDESERADGDAKGSSASEDGSPSLPHRSTSSVAGSHHRYVGVASPEPEFAQLRKQNAAAERRVQKMRAKLEEVYRQRDDLLKELRQMQSLPVVV